MSDVLADPYAILVSEVMRPAGTRWRAWSGRLGRAGGRGPAMSRTIGSFSSRVSAARNVAYSPGEFV